MSPSMKDTLIDAAAELGRFLLGVVIWDALLRQLGRATLLILTAGQWPRGKALKQHANAISASGVIVLLLAWFALASWNHARAAP